MFWGIIAELHPDPSTPEPALGGRARRKHSTGSFWQEHLPSQVPMRPDPGLNQRPSILLSHSIWGLFGPFSYTSSQTAPLHIPTPTQAAPASSKQQSLAPNDRQCEKNRKTTPKQLNLHSPKHCCSWGCPGGARLQGTAPAEHPSAAPLHSTSAPEPKSKGGEISLAP